MKDLEKLIKDNTGEDGVVDYAKVEELVNKETNDIVARQMAKAKEDALNELAGKSSELTKLLEEKEQALAELTDKSSRLEREKMLYAKGITDPDTVDYVLFNLDKRIDDKTDFDTALKSFEEEKPQYFQPAPISTNTPPSGAKKKELLGFEKILAEKYPEDFEEN